MAGMAIFDRRLLAFFDDAGTDASGSTLHEQTINLQRDLAEIERELCKHHALLGRHQVSVKPRQRQGWIEAHDEPLSIKDRYASVLEESQRSTQNSKQDGEQQMRKSKRGSQIRRSQIGRKSRGSASDERGVNTAHSRSSKVSAHGGSPEATRQSTIQLLHPERQQQQQQQQKQQRRSQQQQQHNEPAGKAGDIQRQSTAHSRSGESSTRHRMSSFINIDQRPSMVNVAWAQLLMIVGLPKGRSAHYVAKVCLGRSGMCSIHRREEKRHS